MVRVGQPVGNLKRPADLGVVRSLLYLVLRIEGKDRAQHKCAHSQRQSEPPRESSHGYVSLSAGSPEARTLVCNMGDKKRSQNARGRSRSRCAGMGLSSSLEPCWDSPRGESIISEHAKRGPLELLHQG